MRRHSPKANLLVQSPQLLPQSLGERGEKVVQGLSHDETHVVTVALGLHLRWVLHSALREIGAPCDSQDGESMGTECPAPHLSASRSSSCAKDWLLRDPTTLIDTANRSTARGFDEFPTGALPAAVGHGRAPQDRTPEHLTLAPGRQTSLRPFIGGICESVSLTSGTQCPGCPPSSQPPSPSPWRSTGLQAGQVRTAVGCRNVPSLLEGRIAARRGQCSQVPKSLACAACQPRRLPAASLNRCLHILQRSFRRTTSEKAALRLRKAILSTSGCSDDPLQQQPKKHITKTTYRKQRQSARIVD